MQLSTILASATREETLDLVEKLIQKSKVSVSWYGERLVTVKGYQGTVEINSLVQKYLSVAPAKGNCHNLEERLKFYDLWKKVKQLCKKKGDNLNKTCGGFIYFVSVKEAVNRLLFMPSPRDFILNSSNPKYPSKEEWSFQFSHKDFKKLWPKYYKKNGLGGCSTAYASRNMVQDRVTAGLR